MQTEFGLLLCAFAAISTVYVKATTPEAQSIWNSTYVDRLRKDLLLNYDTLSRPAQHFNKTTVHFTVAILNVAINEFKSTMTVNGWIRMKWIDEKLKWKQDDYGGVDVLYVGEHEVWLPDIHLFNSAANPISHYSGTNCLLYPDGEVLWVPPALFTTFCEMNFKYWPFDTQECFLKFGSWTTHEYQIDLELFKDEVETELLVTNSEWKLVKATQQLSSIVYACCVEEYPIITINITMTRGSPSYRAFVVTPAFVTIFLTLMVFWLPPHSGEKIILNVATILLIYLLMLYFNQKLPAMGNHTPLIVLFFDSCLYVSTFSVIGSVLVIYLSRAKHNSPLPWIIKHTLTGSFGKLLGLHDYITQLTFTHRAAAEEMRDHQVIDFDTGNGSDEHHIIKSTSTQHQSSYQQEWVLLAAAIDRLSFIFYSLLFCLLSVIYSV